MQYSGAMWILWVPRIPALLALLAGAIVALFAFLKGRRRTASCLGGIGFSLLLMLNILNIVLTRRWVSMGLAGMRVGMFLGLAGVFLGLADALAIALLIAAVVLQERKGGASA